MHIFAIAANIPSVSQQRLAETVASVGIGLNLARDSIWQTSSSNGGLTAAGVHHGTAAAANRRYVARDGNILTVFDGLPVDPSARHDARDAAVLARGWDSWVGDLEGQFCAARIELDRERAEILLDTFGLVPVFIARREGGVLAANSVAVISSVLDLTEPDPLAVSSMIGLGWAASRHTLLRDVATLAGGSRHAIGAGRVVTRTHFGPATLTKAERRRRSVEELAREMEGLTRSATHGIEPVRCAVTAGRDSRLVLGLALGQSRASEYYTIGASSDPDVVWAKRLSEHFGFPHRTILPPIKSTDSEAANAISHLVALSDGLSDLNQIIDVLEPARPGPLGCKLSGIGGEIGRNGPFDNTVAAANLPLLGNVAAFQRKVLAIKINSYRHLMTADAQATLDASMMAFFDERLAEGWHVNEVADLYFAFERIGCHAAAAPRRTSATDDFFSPYCTRAYAEFCMTMSPAQRYVELPYQLLLRRISPELFAYPFKTPLPTPRPRRAGLRAARKLTGLDSMRSRLGLAAPAPPTKEPFVRHWFERHIDLMRDLFGHDDSFLWSFLARDCVLDLLHGDPQRREPHVEGLLRSATLFWYFHGQPATCSGRSKDAERPSSTTL